MKQKNKIALVFLCTWLLIALIPSNSMALYTDSYDMGVNDYFFLKFTDQNYNQTATTNISLPLVNTNWMIEVTSLTEGPPVDNLSIKVYEDTGGYLDKWQPTSDFNDTEIWIGAYSDTTGYTLNPAYEAMFPLPLIVPSNWTAAFNQTINASLSNTFNFDNVMFQNMTSFLAMGGPMGGLLGVDTMGMMVAWNGSMMWIDTDVNGSGKYEPYGNESGNFLLVGLYLGNQLNYVLEAWWDNSSTQWNLIYKMMSPTFELIAAMFEAQIPGSGVTGGGGGIPGFPSALVFIGLMVTVAIIYLRKPKEEVII